LDENEALSIFKHFKSHYRSIHIQLVLIVIDNIWKVVFIKAKLLHEEPHKTSELLIDTGIFKIVQGRIGIDRFDELYESFSKGKPLTIEIEKLGKQAVNFPQWRNISILYETGDVVRSAWSENWPHVRFDFESDSTDIPGHYGQKIASLLKSHGPYEDFTEAISDKFRLKEDLIKVDRAGHSCGYLLIPVFCAISRIDYAYKDGKITAETEMQIHPQIQINRLSISARILKRLHETDRIEKQKLDDIESEKSNQLSIIKKVVVLPSRPEDIQAVKFYLLLDSPPIVELSRVDERFLHKPLEILESRKIIRIMKDAEKGGTSARYMDKLGKFLMEGKRNDLEEAVFDLLMRTGFDVIWEGKKKNHDYDFLACSPQGAMAIECTSDLVSQQMIDKICTVSEELEGELTIRIRPVILTNYVRSMSDLDVNTLNLMMSGKINIVTRQDIVRIFEKLVYERKLVTAEYWELFTSR